MPAQSRMTQAFSAPGEIVEIFDDAGERRARIVLRRPIVVDVPAKPLGDVQLGDRVVVDGSMKVNCVRGASDPAVSRGSS